VSNSTNNQMSSGDVKYRLRRDLSNNSTAESEDSNTEDVLEKSLNLKKEVLFTLNGDDMDRERDKSTETIPDKCDSPNFVENLKRFFSRKLQLKEVKRIDNGDPNNNHQSEMERYKQIIEEHKDKLPDNFTIRRFPGSSCAGTFSDLSTAIQTGEMTSASSSASLTPSPIHPYNPTQLVADSGEENGLNSSTSSKSSLAGSSSNFFDDHLNRNNKRFYHVFRQDELDDLIRTYCVDLRIYDSYYDHGNWCICAQKEEQPV